MGADFRHYDYNSNFVYNYNDYSADGSPLINVWNPSSSYQGFTPCFTWNHAGCDLKGWIYNTSYFQQGIYFQDQVKWKRLSILLGGWQDWVNIKYNNNSYFTNENDDNVKKLLSNNAGREPHQPKQAFTWRVGLVYQFDFGLAPYFSYSTSFIPQIGSTDYQALVCTIDWKTIGSRRQIQGS